MGSGYTVEAEHGQPRYAQVTGAQPGWRFDFAILEGGDPTGRKRAEAREFSGDDINGALAEADQMLRLGFIRPAVMAAWAATAAAMRARLRAAGEDAGGTAPRVMINELYSSGILSADEFNQLEIMYQLRNEIVHGFSSPTPDARNVEFLSDLTQRLITESEKAEPQPA